jgi:hypothetical protein
VKDYFKVEFNYRSNYHIFFKKIPKSSVVEPAFNLNAGPDQGSQTNAEPDPGQTLPLQKVEFSHEK